MNEEMNLIRRKGNKKVPEMKEEVLDMKVKKVKSENNQIGVVYKIQGIGESDKEIIWS
jgi:septum formation topological specificity factor MinE